jgi:hypothetical protein
MIGFRRLMRRYRDFVMEEHVRSSKEDICHYFNAWKEQNNDGVYTGNSVALE